MQFIKDHLTVILESFSRAVIRFWNNRFIQDTEVEYYRMELEKLRSDNKELQDKLINVLMPKTVTDLPDEVTDWKQINHSQFVPPSVRRAQLERESYLKARASALQEMGVQSIEELEEKLLVNN